MKFTKFTIQHIFATRAVYSSLAASQVLSQTTKNAMKHPDWNNSDRLSAMRDDALGVKDRLRHPPRPARSAFRRIASVLGGLSVLAITAYWLIEYSGLTQWLAHQVRGELTAGTLSHAPLPSLPPSTAPARIAQQPAPRVTDNPVYAAPPHQSLADCIKPGNLIDESVINCRYGELPRAHNHTPRQGMVSAEYLAQFKANARPTPNRRSAQRDNTQQWIRKWDGKGQYLAQWQSINNRIDGSSVCSNHRKGSIDYRECRKAAKVHFREQCRAWQNSSSRNPDEHSKQMEHRYCSAANGFSPMG